MELDAAAGEKEDHSLKRAAGLICALSSRWASFHRVRDLHAPYNSTEHQTVLCSSAFPLCVFETHRRCMFAFLYHSWRCETGQNCVPFVYFPSGLPRRSLLLPNLSSLTFLFLQNASKLTLIHPASLAFPLRTTGSYAGVWFGTRGMDVWHWRCWGARG